MPCFRQSWSGRSLPKPEKANKIDAVINAAGKVGGIYANNKYKADFILRGLRNTTDFEFENSISQLNKHLNKDLETVFIITSPKHAHISSTIIREVHEYGGNINKFLPYKLK